MIRYRANPHGESRFLEASPEDIRGMRRFVRKVLYDLGFDHDDAEDLAQDVEIVAWIAIEEGRIRERPHEKPFHCLMHWMRETAWRLGLNYKRRFRYRRELHGVNADIAVEDDTRLDARELLAMLTAYPETLALLVLLSEGGMRANGATAKGVYLRAYKARRWLQRVRDSGIWREPPGYEKPRPRDRKKGR